MRPRISMTDDPRSVLEQARSFLVTDSVRHNLVLTLLHSRAASGEVGRYWTVGTEGGAIGVAVLAPIDFLAALTPMGTDAVACLTETLAEDGIHLPGVNGEAETVARFAGAWTEVSGCAAVPFGGQRLYGLDGLQPPVRVSGTLRQAIDADRALLLEWFRAFQVDVGDGPHQDVEAAVQRRLDARQAWLWDDGEPVSMASCAAPTAGVVRIQGVYTPPGQREHGYAGACVAALSERLLSERCLPVLYTDLANPTSNSVYRRIGYRAVAECLAYRFM